ncbi:MAG: lipoteichoic acid synthase, partial [Myxococcota bacterium]
MEKGLGTGRWAALAPPRRTAVLYALALVGPLALLVLGCKLHKLLSVEEGVGPLGLLAGVATDIGVLGALGLVVAWTLSAFDGRGRRLARGFWHVVMLLLSLLALIEHGFFITTGTVLDGYVLSYGLANLGPLKDVYASEMGFGTYLGMGALVGVNLLPRWLTRTARYRAAGPQRYSASAWLRRPIITYAFGTLLIGALGGVALSQHQLPSAAEPLRPNIFASLLGEAFVTPEPEPLLTATAEQAEGYTLVLEPAKPSATPPPNVIVIVLESVRAHATTPYNADLDTTPEIAKLTARGAMAETAYTTLPHTSKSLVGILCGILPKMDTPIEEAGPEGLPTECLAEVLGTRGYKTVFFQAATQRFERRDQLVENMGYAEFFPH